MGKCTAEDPKGPPEQKGVKNEIRDRILSFMQDFLQSLPEHEASSLTPGFTTYRRVDNENESILWMAKPDNLIAELPMEIWPIAFAHKISLHEGCDGFILWLTLEFKNPEDPDATFVAYTSKENSYPEAFLMDNDSHEFKEVFDLRTHMPELYIDMRMSQEDIEATLKEH